MHLTELLSGNTFFGVCHFCCIFTFKMPIMSTVTDNYSIRVCSYFLLFRVLSLKMSSNDFRMSNKSSFVNTNNPQTNLFELFNHFDALRESVSLNISINYSITTIIKVYCYDF